MSKTKNTTKTKETKAVVEASYAEDDYDGLDQRGHIYKKPGMYIGSEHKIKRDSVRFFNLETSEFYYGSTLLPEGIERLFYEIATNASDNNNKSLKRGVKPGPITVTVDKHTVTIRNGGIPIPIKIKQYEGENYYLPEFLLGIPFTSSNFKDEQEDKTSGTNGIGAVATNIFSTEFSVEIKSKNDKKHYYQTWEKNMTIKNEPTIKDYKGESYVEVKYKLDFEKFKIKRYSTKVIERFASISAGISASAKVVFIFNGIKIDNTDFVKFCKNITELPDAKYIVHYEWDKDVKPVKKKKGIFEDPKGSLANMEICIIDSPDAGNFHAFTNGIENAEGGVHVEKVYDELKDFVLPSINDKIAKDGGKKLTKRDLKNHLSIVVFFRDFDPEYSGQEKHKVKSPIPYLKFDEEEVKGMNKWSLTTRLTAALKAKRIELLAAQSDGSKSGSLNMEKVTEANWAKKRKNPDKCYLVISEGDSAARYETTRRSSNTSMSDYIGILTGKGKWINPLKCTDEKFYKNNEVRMLRKTLGIRVDVEPTLKNLRYNHIIIRADADVDGDHIAGLILLVIRKIAPILITEGRVYIGRTPLIKVWITNQREKTVKFFYSETEYVTWEKKDPIRKTKKWHKKYYKGLGTSEAKDIKENEKNPMDVTLIYDKEADVNIDVAFGKGKELSTIRKKWINDYIPDDTLYTIKKLDISDFINKQVVKHSVANTQRSIPDWRDGLKESYRKFLFGGFKKFTRTVNTDKSIKLSQLGPFVAEVSGYHYGEASLYGVGNTLASKYVGGFNMNLFYPGGQFGARMKGVKSAAQPRYITTCLEKWIPYIFRKEDDILLDFKEEEGVSIEPECYFPIAPLAAINGNKGIGTAWSTKMANHSVLGVTDYVLDVLDNIKPERLIPSYRGFKGTIILYVKSDSKELKKLRRHEREQDKLAKEKTKDEKILDPDQEEPEEEEPEEEDSDDEDEDLEDVITQVVYSKRNRNRKDHETEEITANTKISDPSQYSTCVTKGLYEVLENGDIQVIELPVEMTIFTYRKWLGKQIDLGNITDYDDNFGDHYVNCVIHGMTDPTYKKLNLIKSIRQNNIVMLVDNKPRLFRSVEEYLDLWIEWRLTIYEKRKLKKIELVKEEIKQLNLKRFFVEFVNNGKLVYKKVSNKTIRDNMEKLEIPYKFYDNASLKSLEDTNIEKFDKTIESKKKELKLIETMASSKTMYNELLEFQEFWEKYVNSEEEKEYWLEALKDIPNPRYEIVE